MSLRSDIEVSRKRLCINTQDFSEVAHFAYKTILKKIWNRFTKLGHKAEDYFWINSHIENAIGYQPKSGEATGANLKDIVPPCDKVWFVGQQTMNEQPKYWLYEGALHAVVEILDDMYFFDFYIVEKKFNWIVSENHHGILIASGEPVATKLSE